MEPRLKELFKGVYFERDQTNRHKLKIFLICLGISIFIWFLIVLSNESSTTLHYPIVYTNAPADLILANHPDSILSLKIASGGFELATNKYLTRKKPVEVDLSELVLEKQNNYLVGTYPTAQIAAGMKKNFNFSEELVSISPEILVFKFEPLIGKRVPIIPKLDLEFEPPYRLSGNYGLMPDSVNISGPDNIIANISYIETQLAKIEGIKEMASKELVLLNPAEEQVKMGVKTVKVVIHAEKFTESTISIPIVALNSGLKVKTFPSHVNITYLVSLKDFSRISPDMFNAGVIIPSENKSNRVGVQLDKKPSFIEVVLIEPAEVEYLLIKQ